MCELSLVAVNVQDMLEMTENVENRVIESKTFQLRTSIKYLQQNFPIDGVYC